MHEVLTLVLGGGRGTRLYPLTRSRSEPAVPVAGKYRLIDIPVSNAINSGLSRLYVLTQYLSVSLHRHIANTYKRDAFSNGFIEVLAAQQTNEKADWYQGTADALRQNLRYIQEDGARDVLILSGDQLYRMDFGQLIASHREQDADITMAVVPVARGKASNVGIVCVDEHSRVSRLIEKPQTDEQLGPFCLPPGWLESRGVGEAGPRYLANMGIYVINRQVLFDVLGRLPAAADLVMEIFPHCVQHGRVGVHLFTGYWEDLGTIGTYHQANLALASDHPPFDFHSPEGVIYTRMRFLPASRVSGAEVTQCLISDGCVVQSGTRLERCVLGVRSRIGNNVTLRDTIMMGANDFESDRGAPPLGIDKGSVLERVIVDKNCRIGSDVRLVNREKRTHADGPFYAIRDGIIVIPNGTTVPDGTEI